MHVDWHPIRGKDDLPTKSGKYLVTVYDSLSIKARCVVKIADYDADDLLWLCSDPAWLPASWAWEGSDWIWQRVIAWRPMPKPYEEEA
jgi:hypothetical protein